jgi:hypothetical protein
MASGSSSGNTNYSRAQTQSNYAHNVPDPDEVFKIQHPPPYDTLEPAAAVDQTKMPFKQNIV